MNVKRRDMRGIYDQLASEYGVTPGVVRTICGPLNGPCRDDEDWGERVAVMRGKLEMYGLTPLQPADNKSRCLRTPTQVAESKDESEGEVSEFSEGSALELRPCLLCEELLADEDPGQEVVNSEDGSTGVICRKCGVGEIRY